MPLIRVIEGKRFKQVHRALLIRKQVVHFGRRFESSHPSKQSEDDGSNFTPICSRCSRLYVRTYASWTQAIVPSKTFAEIMFLHACLAQPPSSSSCSHIGKSASSYRLKDKIAKVLYTDSVLSPPTIRAVLLYYYSIYRFRDIFFRTYQYIF